MEAKPQAKNNSKPTRDIALWVGVMALVINIITVSVYILQASIMQAQQHASAWPYLEWLPSFNEETYFIEISNNGTGPAIIKKVDIILDTQAINNMDSLFIQLVGIDYFPHIISTVQNRVLPAGKSIRLFQINEPKWARKVFAEMLKHDFTMTICYESIYAESWTSMGIEVISTSCR